MRSLAPHRFPKPGRAAACVIHDASWRSSMSSTVSSSTPREVLTHPDRRGRRNGRQCGAAPERELDVAGESATREAPAVADAIPRHAPFHAALEGRQRLGRQGIDTFGDGALRLRQAADVGEDRLVAHRGLRGTCSASHGNRQRAGHVGLRGCLLSGFLWLRRHAHCLADWIVSVATRGPSSNSAFACHYQLHRHVETSDMAMLISRSWCRHFGVDRAHECVRAGRQGWDVVGCRCGS